MIQFQENARTDGGTDRRTAILAFNIPRNVENTWEQIVLHVNPIQANL